MAGILDGYIDRDDLARDLRCSGRTLARYETEADGLPSVMIGGRKFYRVAAVKAWLEKRETWPNPRRRA
jgi:hypothetical protein